MAGGVEDQACTTNAGVYYLPRKLLVLRVKAATPGPGFDLEFESNQLQSSADRSTPLCLDYLSAVTADDQLVVQRTSEGLLKNIYANAEDKSKDIAIAFIDAARLAAVEGGARARRGIPFSGGYLAMHEMDPFDPAAAAAINESMREFGYCVYVEGYTFDPRRLTPEAYCQRPLTVLLHLRELANRAPAGPPPALLQAEARRGVLYRPNQTHHAVVMYNRDPDRSKLWRMQRRLSVEMPNAAPVFSIAVDRTYFATRKTTLLFQDGVLKDVDVDKDSELNAIADVTLHLVQSIVAIPSQVVQLRINRVNNERAVINAQGQLLSTYREYLKERGLPVTPGVPPPSATSRSKADACRAQFENGDQEGYEACVRS